MVILNQPAGLGDLIFIQTIANDFIRENHKVVIPVWNEHVVLNKHFPNVTFISKDLLKINYEEKKDYTVNGARIIPLRFAEAIQKLPYKDCMKAKYSLLGLDWNRWREMTWVRHPQHEHRLFSEVLGLQEGERYNLINTNFRFDNSGRANFTVNNGLKNVFMTVREGYTLLDWSKVIQQATQIHQVSSAMFYVCELLDLKCEENHLYVRRDNQKIFQEKDFSTVEYLFTKKYSLHY